MVSTKNLRKELDERHRTPLISGVVSKIAELIRLGELKPGEGLPSERKLASDYGVSRGVIRGAIQELAEQGLLEAKPRCRPIVKAPSQPQSYRGSPARRHIGIWLWPNMADFAAASILKGIQSTDLGKDVRLIVANAKGQDWESIFESEADFLKSLADDPEEAGAILYYLGGERNLPHLRRLREANVPTVFVDRQPPAGFESDFVGSENRSAARRGVQHLIDLGHRRIAMITNSEQVSSVFEREIGYRHALTSKGIPVRPEYIFEDSVDAPEGVEAALDAFLSLPEPPTAVFCLNDHIALQLMDALQARKMAVPQRMSVLGVDGLLRWVPSGGYLTTLLQDFERMGQLAAELVLERMQDGPPAAYRHILIDSPLAERGSTAPPAAEQIFLSSNSSEEDN